MFLFAYILGPEQQRSASVPLLPSCYGDIKPVNGPPPRDREVLSVKLIQLCAGIRSSQICLVGNSFYNYIDMINMVLNIDFGYSDKTVFEY